jgi:Helix-turn-helix domain
MENFNDDKWLSRQELADRCGLPVKTAAQWASKGTGPRYAKIGRHVRCRLSDLIDREKEQFRDNRRDDARHGALTKTSPRPDGRTADQQAESR